MTFSPKNKEHKKQLYRVLRALADLESSETAETLFDKGVGRPVARGIDYMNNVRKGEYSSTFAALIYRWLLKNHFPIAHEFAPNIFPETVPMRWRAILDERAIIGQFKIAIIKHGMGVVQRASAGTGADVSLKLGQYFCLQLATDRKGYAVALQGINNDWHAIEIGQDGGYVAQIEPGENLMPRLANGLLDPLSENGAAGLYDFILFHAASQSIPVTIDDLVTWANASECDIHHVKADIR